MAETIYKGSRQAGTEPALPPPIDPELRKSFGYIPSEALKAAVDVALLLGQPLLVSGEPGTGKTTLARAIADELFSGRYLEMQVKSSTARNDLLYRIDELARFRDAHRQGASRPLLDYFELQPLGEAIVRACGPDAPLFDRAGRLLFGNEPFLREVFGERQRRNTLPTLRALLPAAQSWTGPERCVVLIDEIDKAPRDTPNDLLEEFEHMSFAIPELGIKVVPPTGAPRPVVIVTSNSEKSLPDAFLRRCAFHHIEFPSREELRKIIEQRLGAVVINDAKWLTRLLELIDQLRTELTNAPSTAEILALLHLLKDAKNSKELTARLNLSLAAFVKLPQDLITARHMIASWED